MSESTPDTDSILPPGSLWSRVTAQTTHALACGALQSIPTHTEFLEEGGIRFLVRTLANLARKEQAKKKQSAATANGKPFNPFLPHDPDLFVGNLSQTHLCLLNKYNVVDHHLLVVTRAFESQETWLNRQDFGGIWRCLSEIDGLAFYNGGPLAGASQRHKHLQLIPAAASPIPIDAVLEFEQVSTPQVLPSLPFRHSTMALETDSDPASRLLEAYHQLLQRVGLDVQGQEQTGAYNLLFTRRWMLVVPRSREAFKSISVNSLGFAGSLFVRDNAQLELLKAHGPMNVLKQVAIAQ